MSQANPPPPDRRQATAQNTVDDSSQRTRTAWSRVQERIAPWLLELGSWIFGALIAANLVFLGALLAVGRVDSAVVVSSAALAIALPMNVTGFFLLRLAKDLRLVGLEAVTMQAFHEAGFTTEELGASPVSFEASEKKRAEKMVSYSYSLLLLSAVLTVVGVTAALWHIAWWIGAVFVVMSVACQFIVSRAVSVTGSKLKWRLRAGRKGPRGSAPHGN